MALANTMVNSAPVSTEELLSKGTKKASLSPEDDTVFVEKNSSQLGYERTWEQCAQFNIESNGDMNAIELQHDSYGMRADNAYLYTVWNITLKGDSNDCACPANMFPFVAFDSLRMRIGLNQAEVISPNEHYIHKFLNIMNSNLSKQDKINVLPLFGCFPEFDLSQAKYRLLLAKMLGFVFTGSVTEVTLRVPFIIPLTVLHRMFNHKTILPVGTRFDFQFNTNKSSNKNAIIQPSATYTGTFEFLPRESYLYAQYPERDPAIMLAQLENRQYISEGLDYETYRIEIPTGSSYASVPILRPGSKMPVKIDFGFVPSENLNNNKDIFTFVGANVSRIDVVYNGPFPTQYQLKTVSGKGNGLWEDGSGNALDKFPLFSELFNQTDTFLTDRYGESYNNETTYPPLKRINPYMAAAAEYPILTFSQTDFTILKDLHDKRQVYTVILQPSKIFDGSAYPTVEGSLDLNICFSKATTVPYILYVNCNYFQQIILNENYQCDIRNITLDNFRGSGDSDLSSELPPPSDDSNLSGLPVGEADNVV